jgi:D-erythro-7,8-dihydroneopterin triphosphate epimerase
MVIRIKDLRLRTIIGINDWERKRRQDVIVNAELILDDPPALQTDRVEDTLDYREACRRIIAEVEGSQCGLIERLLGRVLDQLIAMPRVKRATVEIDKPHALRFADSVSVSATRERNG